MTSEVIRIAQEFQNALRSRQYAVVGEMADVWLRTWRVFDELIHELTIEIEQAMQSARWPLVGEQWIRELEYYKALRIQVYEQYAQYQRWLDVWLEEQRYFGYMTGNLEAVTLVGASYAHQFTRLADVELELLYAQFRAGTPLERLLSPLGEATWLNIQHNLFEGLATGQPLRVIAARMTQASNLAFQRASVIARTEILRARRESTRQAYEASGIVRGFKRFANKATACLACLLLDGEFYSVESEFEDHPNGACAIIPWIKSGDEPTWQTGLEHFLSLSPEAQAERMGKEYYKAWRAGMFELKDMAWHKPNAEWGAAPQIRSLWELEGYESYADKIVDN